MFNTPILFLIFNRPDTTEKVFEKIREIKPRQLFVAADGPREGNEKDRINCEAARSIATNVDWECEVRTLFRTENLECGIAVSQAISWFFEEVEMGIILEDDVLVDSSFFSFSQELLLYYESNERVAHIGGSNFQDGKNRSDGSYYFSKYTHSWGWATWRKHWNLFNFEINDTPEEIEAVVLNYCSKKKERLYWNNVFNKMKTSKDKSIWDYQWLYYIWKAKGICILPNQNLVENIGFRSDATHTFNSFVDYNKNWVKPLLKIQHPKSFKINHSADWYSFKNHFSTTGSIKNKLRNIAYKVVPFQIYKKLKELYRGRGFF